RRAGAATSAATSRAPTTPASAATPCSTRRGRGSRPWRAPPTWAPHADGGGPLPFRGVLVGLPGLHPLHPRPPRGGPRPLPPRGAPRVLPRGHGLDHRLGDARALLQLRVLQLHARALRRGHPAARDPRLLAVGRGPERRARVPGRLRGRVL